MKNTLTLLIFSIVLFSCKRSDKKSVYFLSPAEGLSISSGKDVFIKTDAEPGSFDSIRYFIDNRFAGSRKDTSGISVSTNGLPLGGRLLTAKVFNGNDSTEVITNIQLLASKAPLNYGYIVVNTFPHDTTSYTQGLEYHDGVLYESDGEYEGNSSLRKTELKTGKVLKQINIDPRYFAEGITVIDNKIVQLTYREGVGFEYDKNTFKKLKEFPYTAGREGWGLCFDGKQILNTDGTNNIYFLNKNTYQKEATLEVYDSNGPVDSLNELELIDGKIYANLYMKDSIAVIDPKTGAVEAYLNLAGILPAKDHFHNTNVLNGIAWDAKGKRLFVTGKKWNKLFEIKIM